MQIEQRSFVSSRGWQIEGEGRLSKPPQLVLVFGVSNQEVARSAIDLLREYYPQAQLIGCSTAGEILGTRVCDGTITATAVVFERICIRVAMTELNDVAESFAAGERLAHGIPMEGLKHAFVLSDGLQVNGSELVRGIVSHLPPGVALTGGLAGDGSRFQETWVVHNDTLRSRAVVMIGFYGEGLSVGFASVGGWDPFGPERLVTRSRDNVVSSFDHQPALELYKRYLGPHASGLPATGLLFPLSVRTHEEKPAVVRTILAVDEHEQSMTFAGNVPEGSYARLMKANFDRLIDGAATAARMSRLPNASACALAILISCVGRKLILKQRVEEEIEGAREMLGEKTITTGFYSYGEIAPYESGGSCELHNQTMTITTLSEELP